MKQKTVSVRNFTLILYHARLSFDTHDLELLLKRSEYE